MGIWKAFSKGSWERQKYLRLRRKGKSYKAAKSITQRESERRFN